MSEAPHRAYRLQLDVEADDVESLIGYLRNFETQLYCDQISRGVSGGSSAGASYELTVDPDMTHDRYFELVNAWIAERDAEKKAAAT